MQLFSADTTLKLGNNELFGRPKIVPGSLMPKVSYPYEVNGKLVTGNGSLKPIYSLSNSSLLPSLTVQHFQKKKKKKNAPENMKKLSSKFAHNLHKLFFSALPIGPKLAQITFFPARFLYNDFVSNSNTQNFKFKLNLNFSLRYYKLHLLFPSH